MRVINGLDEMESLVGTKMGTSEWVTVTQAMVQTFSDVTGDHQWIHLDVERAKRELPFGGPIVQGLLTLSLIVRFRNEIVDVRGVSRVINYGLNRVRYPAPVPVGTRIRGTQTLVSAERRMPTTLRVTNSMMIEAEAIEKPVCVAETISLLYA